MKKLAASVVLGLFMVLGSAVAFGDDYVFLDTIDAHKDSKFFRAVEEKGGNPDSMCFQFVDNLTVNHTQIRLHNEGCQEYLLSEQSLVATFDRRVESTLGINYLVFSDAGSLSGSDGGIISTYSHPDRLPPPDWTIEVLCSRHSIFYNFAEFCSFRIDPAGKLVFFRL